MYILSIFSILQICANYNKNLCEKGDIYNFNEIVTIGFCGRERVDYMTYDTKGVLRREEWIIRYRRTRRVKHTRLVSQCPAGESMPGGEGNRRQIK